MAGGVVRIWRVGPDARIEASLGGYPGELQHVRVDGDDVYAITGDPVAIVLDSIGDAMDAPMQRRIFWGPTRSIEDVWLDRKRGQVLAASTDQFLYVWDLATGALAHKLEGTGPLRAVRMSPDGSLMIGVGGISPAVWDRATGARLGQLEGHSALVTDGEFIDDRLFISTATNQTALIWDVDAARPLTKLHDVEAIVVAPDRRSVVFGGGKGARLWTPRAPAPDLDALGALLPPRSQPPPR
jgi:WD40 repeat protein